MNRLTKASEGHEADMYDDQPYPDDYRSSAPQGYQNLRKGNRQLRMEPGLNLC